MGVLHEGESHQNGGYSKDGYGFGYASLQEVEIHKDAFSQVRVKRL